MGILVNNKIKYRLDELDKLEFKYALIWGGRNIGKSYAVKERAIIDAWNDDNKKFAYVRRWAEDIKAMYCESYFASKETVAIIKKVTKNKANCITYHNGSFYFSLIDKEGVKKNIKKCGRAFCLSKAERYKSLEYTDTSTVIFEEFLTDESYLQEEPKKLDNILSTISRDNNTKCYMIANTISRVNPYISYWGLNGVLRQQQGTIEQYKMLTGEVDEKNNEEKFYNIVCQYCAEQDIEVGAKVVNKDANNSMIKYGQWETKQAPYFNRKELDNYRVLYTVVFEYDGFKFLMRLLQENKEVYPFWYVERKTTRTKEGTRIISNKIQFNPLWTDGFTALTQEEQIAFGLIERKFVKFCDNLTAKEFWQCYKM